MRRGAVGLGAGWLWWSHDPRLPAGEAAVALADELEVDTRGHRRSPGPRADAVVERALARAAVYGATTAQTA
jgi:hypothetical protein